LAGGGENADLAPAAPDLTPNNPPNPAGLGPAPVDVGAAGNLGAPGSYVLLAKTGITFITGFSLTADPSNVYATSASVMAPSKIYAADYAAPTPANLTSAVLGMESAYTDAAGRTPPDHLNLSSGN